MSYLIWLIPLVIFVFITGDSIADAMIYRKKGVGWWTWHRPNWVRRYSSNGLLVAIWFYLSQITYYTISLALIFILLMWAYWKLLYLLISKRIKIKIE